MTPTGGETGAQNVALLFALNLASRRRRLVRKAWDSSTGFGLPGSSVLCPDPVVERSSARDAEPRGLAALRQPMGRYQANGARLGWWLRPEQPTVEIRRGGCHEPENLEKVALLKSGESEKGRAVPRT